MNDLFKTGGEVHPLAVRIGASLLTVGATGGKFTLSLETTEIEKNLILNSFPTERIKDFSSEELSNGRTKCHFKLVIDSFTLNVNLYYVSTVQRMTFPHPNPAQ